MYLLDFFRLVPKSRKVKIKSKKGIIFNNPDGLKRYIFYISNIILLFSLILMIYIYSPVTKAWLDYKNISSTETERVDDIKNIPVSSDEFVVKVPKILAEAKVVKNVDVSDKITFDKILKNGNVALSTGSDLPGGGPGNMMFLFAHSTEQNIFGGRDNAVFYLLNELEIEDEIFLSHKGEEFIYSLYDKKVVSAKETSYLDYKLEEEEVIILQTCWPVGTNWKRLLVFAKRI